MTAPRLTPSEIERTVSAAKRAGAVRVRIEAHGRTYQFDLREETAEPADEFDLVDMRR
jgi:hypothetical protein